MLGSRIRSTTYKREGRASGATKFYHGLFSFKKGKTINKGGLVVQKITTSPIARNSYERQYVLLLRFCMNEKRYLPGISLGKHYLVHTLDLSGLKDISNGLSIVL